MMFDNRRLLHGRTGFDPSAGLRHLQGLLYRCGRPTQPVPRAAPETSMKQVQFRQMRHGTANEYRMLGDLEQTYAAALPQRLMQAMELLGDSLQGYQVSRLQHSLQAATRAERDGADEELIAPPCCTISATISPPQPCRLCRRNPAAVCAPGSHLDRSAARPVPGLLTTRITPAATAMRGRHCVGTNGSMLALRSAKSGISPSFDPDYDTLPLSHFAPLV